MVTHVSVRLYWHDGGWNGAICNDPAANSWCEAHDHVRDNKDPGESNYPGVAIDASPIKPGCEMSAQAFSIHSSRIRDWPPSWMKSQGVRPVDRPIKAMSAPMWPYEIMWSPEGKLKANQERRQAAEDFFHAIEPGKSLVFLYVDERNPLLADDGVRSSHRVLVGISRLRELGKIDDWAEPTRNDETNIESY